MTDTLVKILEPLNVAIVSYDDFYLTYKDQQLLNSRFPDNPLL